MESLERSLPLKILFSIFLLFIITSPTFAQVTATQQDIKFQTWVLAEGIPSVDEPVTKDDYISLPVKKLKEQIPFIISGMIYGWDFEYVPYDKLRGVAEFFDFSPVEEIQYPASNISYSEMKVEDGKLFCWVTYKRTDEMFALRQHWNSASFPHIKGKGYGSILNNFEGLQEAFNEAIKDAVREHYRTFIKNKPKEIRGRVLLEEEPLVNLYNGKYAVQIKLILRTEEIISYSAF